MGEGQRPALQKRWKGGRHSSTCLHRTMARHAPFLACLFTMFSTCGQTHGRCQRHGVEHVMSRGGSSCPCRQPLPHSVHSWITSLAAWTPPVCRGWRRGACSAVKAELREALPPSLGHQSGGADDPLTGPRAAPAQAPQPGPAGRPGRSAPPWGRARHRGSPPLG
jgi:hypothetical protein